MNHLRTLGALVVLILTPAVGRADPVQLTTGSFNLGRPLIGTMAMGAALVWANPPVEFFGSPPPDYVYATWYPEDGYVSTLLGTTAPVLPLPPGTAPVGGTFSSPGVALEFTGGQFVIPSVFPPTDSEDLYTVTAPFAMTGHWTIDFAVADGTVVRFDRDIVARGHARLVLGAERTTGNSVLSAVIYDFEAGATPVPDPSTILFVGLGAAALTARRFVACRRSWGRTNVTR
jgi:hypothetical protein